MALVANPRPEKEDQKVVDNGPLSLFVFKTISDPFAGQISFFKVFSGCAHDNDSVFNYKQQAQEKLAHLSIMQGKKPLP